MNDAKIINDPVFGFIKIPQGLLLNIVQHPLMQRLTRIKQLGMANVVYPAAQHTRFQHSIGAFHLMSEAILSLQQKGHFIFDSEAEAVEAAILMHDIGHGPFSHVLEDTLITGISHEEISLLMMEQINREMQGALNLALKIFKGDYPKQFLHELISIKMLDIVDDKLVVNSKGIYSIENYLTTRRLMYWQVYLHKTTVAFEKMLVNTLRRAKMLARQEKELFASPALRYFLYNEVDASFFEQHHDEALHNYSMLDDSDIWSALKVWMTSEDKILALLSSNLINRHIFRVEIHEEPVTQERIDEVLEMMTNYFDISREDASYLMSVNTIQKDMYDVNDDRIAILYRDGSIRDISDASEILNVALLSKKIRKYYLCYQRIS